LWCAQINKDNYTQDEGDALALKFWDFDSSSGGGWRTCGMDVDYCKSSCEKLGSCQTIWVGANGCCYPSQTYCAGDSTPGGGHGSAMKYVLQAFPVVTYYGPNVPYTKLSDNMLCNPYEWTYNARASANDCASWVAAHPSRCNSGYFMFDPNLGQCGCITEILNTHDCGTSSSNVQSTAPNDGPDLYKLDKYWQEKPGEFWCGQTNKNQYQTPSGSVLPGGSWQYQATPDGGWTVCGVLTPAACQSACEVMGGCAEVWYAADLCCYPSQTLCAGNDKPGGASGAAMKYVYSAIEQ